MNSHQRRIFKRKKKREICPYCGEPGNHAVTGYGFMPDFLTCSNCYDKDGRRIIDHTHSYLIDPLYAIAILSSL